MQEIRATAGQRVLWLMDAYRGGNGMMSVPILYRLHGPLDVPALRHAVQDVVERHEALRTTFGRQRRQLVQRVHSGHSVELETVEVAPGEADSLGELMRNLLRRSTDTSASAVRAVLIAVAPHEHLFILDIHHLVTDAWSNMLISRDLTACYNQRTTGIEQGKLPDIDWQSSDYSRWQESHLQGARLKGHQDFWRDHLAGAEFPVTLPEPERTGRLRPLARNEWFSLDPELLVGLRDIARQERTTRFVVLFSIFFMALQDLTGQSDLTVGSIFANRARPEVQETAGFFANMVPIRAAAGPDGDRRAVIRSVRRSVLEAMEHEELPFLSLPAVRNPSTSGLLQDVVFHMLAVPPTATSTTLGFSGLRTEAVHIPDGLGTRFDLELLILPAESGLEGVLRYAGDRYPKSYIEQLADSYRTIAHTLARNAAEG